MPLTDRRAVTTRDRLNTPWRRMAAAIFSEPTEAHITTTIELDVTAVEAYRQARRKPGEHLGLIHFFVAAVARSVAYDAPEINSYLRRGTLHQKKSVDIVVTAYVPGTENLIDLKIRQAHLKPVREIAAEMHAMLADLRSREKAAGMEEKYLLSRIPWPFRRWTFRFLKWLAVGLGIPLRRFEMAPEDFGSLILSDVGPYLDRRSYGQGARISSAHGALFPAAQSSCMLAMCSPEERPVVRDGAVVIREMLPLCGTFDHRLVDAAHATRLYVGVNRRLQAPELLDGPPEESALRNPV